MHISSIVKCLLIGALTLPSVVSAQDLDTANPDEAWNSRLKAFYFQERPIATEPTLIELTAPTRAEDGAIVPITIKSTIPQTQNPYIQHLYLIIDKNPNPLAGKFTFTPKSGRANLDLFIRVDAYSPVRVVAETSDGKLSMTSRFVKASGGCSAPAGNDLQSAMKRLGTMRFKTDQQSNASGPTKIELLISHPNLSGLQRDQVTTLPIPAHYIKKVEVAFEGEPVFAAETDISISENPNFGFYFMPDKRGTLVATMTDTKGESFTHSQVIEPKTVTH